jgi:tetratricopeptide (TPR) repeat protein
VRGGAPGRASRWFCRAIEQSLEGSDLDAAISLGARALESAEEPWVRCAVGSMIAEAHRWRAEYGLARERAAAALENATKFTPAWFVAACELIVACASHGDMAAALPHLRLAAETVVSDDARAEQIKCVMRGCAFLHGVGQFDEAKRLRQCVLPTNEGELSLGPDVLARVHVLDAMRAIDVGDAGASVEDLEAAISCFEAADESRMACQCRTNLGAIYYYLGEFERAERVLTQVLATAERLGAARVKVYTLINMSDVLADSGRATEARVHGALAAELGERQEDPRAEGSARANLSHLALEAGETEVALREAAAAVRLLSGQTLLLPIALARYADALLSAGRAEDAREKIEQAVAIVDAHDGVEVREATVRWVQFRVLTATGELARAREAIDVARERLHVRAARITNTAVREAFLTRVPDNAATLRRAASSTDD